VDKPAGKPGAFIESNLFKRRLFFAAGHICTFLGVIALILPLIPTSPFLIVGAACYARSSEKFYRLLLGNRYFGPVIRQWEQNRCLERRVKLTAFAVLAAAFLSSAFLFLDTWPGRGLVILVGMIAILCVAGIPTCRGGDGAK